MIEYKAKQHSVSLDFRSGRKLVTFEIEEGCSNEQIDFCQEKDLRINIKPWKEKRSLDANGYYYKLLGMLASKLQMSISELHNRMLSDYGKLEEIGGNLVTIFLPDTLEAERKAALSETYHLKPTSNVSCETRMYYMVRGSHTYDTEEFSNLLNGLISECKWQGIPTDTPDQIAQMMSAYKESHK